MLANLVKDIGSNTFGIVINNTIVATGEDKKDLLSKQPYSIDSGSHFKGSSSSIKVMAELDVETK